MKIEHKVMQEMAQSVLNHAYPRAQIKFNIQAEADVMDVVIYVPETGLYHAGSFDFSDWIEPPQEG